MAWIEVELDEGTYRFLRERANREGLTVAEVLSHVAAKEARHQERAHAFAAASSVGWESGAQARVMSAAGRGQQS